MNIRNFLGYTSSNNLISFGLLLFRLVVGGLMLTHGIPKLMNFAELSQVFPDLLGIGSKWNLILVIFAELGCAIALIFGFLIRLSSIPLIITMLMAAFVAHATDPLAVKEMSLLYLSIFSFFFIVGGGKFSLDSLIFKTKLSKK